MTVPLELMTALLEYLDLFMQSKDLCNLKIFLLPKLYYDLKMLA